ncbi:MAG TPA: hypothetical protein VHX68_05285 [Planctomycetaceae bacterium]|nr:hypothetical protein [Planctomycetaceae bacterium]
MSAPPCLTRNEGLIDRLKHRFRVAEQLVVPIPIDANAPVREKFGSRCITASSLVGVVLTAVHFNCQSGFFAVEVDDVRVNRLLPAEFETSKTPVPQQHPQQRLRIGLLLAQLAGPLEQLWIEWRMDPPSPCRNAVFDALALRSLLDVRDSVSPADD